MDIGVKMFLHYGDLCDATNLISIISKVKPTEIYNLGAMSHVKVSFDMPEYTADCDGVGVLRMLDAIRAAGLEKKVKFYQASTSELYGKVQEVPQSETTPFYPRSPYAGKLKLPSCCSCLFMESLVNTISHSPYLNYVAFYIPFTFPNDDFSCQAICFLDPCKLS